MKIIIKKDERGDFYAEIKAQNSKVIFESKSRGSKSQILSIAGSVARCCKEEGFIIEDETFIPISSIANIY